MVVSANVTLDSNHVNGFRNQEYITTVQEGVKRDINSICSLTQKDQVYAAIDKYFSPSDRVTK